MNEKWFLLNLFSFVVDVYIYSILRHFEKGRGMHEGPVDVY